MSTIFKYPSTAHIEGSGIQKGDDKEIVPFEHLFGKRLVIEEKEDGANTGISFNENTLELQLQSRGHFLTGNDWPEFDPFKTWANTWTDKLFDMIGTKYVMYGEWMYAFHSVYYDRLPHFFMEFDLYDKENKVFLDTPTRHAITKGDLIVSVPVLEIVDCKYADDFLKHVYQRSLYVSDNSVANLQAKMAAKRLPESLQRNLLALNQAQMREGIYVKWEEDGIVKERYKFVREDFVQTILIDEVHWSDRPTIPNEMAPDRSMY